MTTTPAISAGQRDPALLGQIVVVIGGSSGLETARDARAEGAGLILANTALTGATYDIDGNQQLVSGG